MKKGISGFTLMEILIAVAIVGILAAVAYPAYQDQVAKTRRSDAKIALTQAASAQERFFTQNNSYTANTADVGGATSPEGYYAISIPVQTTTTFTLTATAIGAQAGDANCASFSITHTGAKTATNTDCW